MKKTRTVDLLFILFVLLCLLLALAKTLFLPKAINYYENRYAKRVSPFSVSAWLDGSFQSDMEAGLNDQIPGAQRLKKLYHQASSALQRPLISALAKYYPNEYISIRGKLIFGDFLCYPPSHLSWVKPQLEARAENYNNVVSLHPETEFYLYYVEKDTDIDFSTGEKDLQAFDCLKSTVTAIPTESMGHLDVADFTQYSQMFYQTDHHWAHRGSYRGYTELLSMLAPEEAPLTPLEEVCIGTGKGSKANGRELSTFSEPFYVYRFDFPAMEVSINGSPAEDYGAQSKYLAGQAAEGPSYGRFYGGDDGLVTLHVPGNEGRGNLLMLGDSFDNAVIKLLASHFDSTYAVDLRYYKTFSGAEFHLADFIEQYHIDKVLLVGNIDYFVSNDFVLED